MTLLFEFVTSWRSSCSGWDVAFSSTLGYWNSFRKFLQKTQLQKHPEKTAVYYLSDWFGQIRKICKECNLMQNDSYSKNTIKVEIPVILWNKNLWGQILHQLCKVCMLVHQPLVLSISRLDLTSITLIWWQVTSYSLLVYYLVLYSIHTCLLSSRMLA